MSGPIGLVSTALATAAALVAASAFSSANAYDDVPGPIYDNPPAVGSNTVYGYQPARPGVRVYGYGPVYRDPPSALPRRDRQPLGTYAPSEGDNLSPSRGFFRGVERESGGD